jgi:pimeloyl-ACP methyl ester carboxylesterase
MRCAGAGSRIAGGTLPGSVGGQEELFMCATIRPSIARAGSRIAECIPAPGGTVVCHVHLPAGRRAWAAVVICSPLFAEAAESSRAEVLLADRLAAGGLAAARFDYRGCGNSGGDPAELTLASAERDCFLVAERLRTHADVDAVGIVGTRWGALVAAAAAGPARAAAIALWDAKPDGGSYIAELVRARTFADLWFGDRHPAGHHRQQLEAGRPLDIRGWRVHPALIASVRSESLAGLLPPRLPTRLVHGSGRRADADGLRADLEAHGCPVTVEVLPEQILWWAGSNPMLGPPQPPAPLEREAPRTAAWFEEVLAA